MKTAVIIASHMRTCEHCLPTIHWHVLRHFPEVDFFVSTVRDPYGQHESARLLRDLYPGSRVEIEVLDSQPELPIPVPPRAEDWTLGRMYTHEPYRISVHPQAILRQLWQLEQGWKFFRERCGMRIDYELIIRLRPDSWFRRFERPPELAAGAGALDAWTPWWGTFGGVNDRFALLGTLAAEAYHTTYRRMPELLAAGCPLHPESLIAASLRAEGCCLHPTLDAWFSKLYGPEDRDRAGTYRDPEVLPFETPQQRATP